MQQIVELLEATGPEARLRVDLKTGYISYGAQDWEKALTIFAQEGLRLRIQRNIFDDGRVIFGNPFRNDSDHGSC